MPHYQDGAEAKVGDTVKFKDYQGVEQIGQIESIHPGSQTCNAVVSVIVTTKAITRQTETIGKMDLLHRPTEQAA